MGFLSAFFIALKKNNNESKNYNKQGRDDRRITRKRNSNYSGEFCEVSKSRIL
jgi:hypothetical protein